MWWCSSCSGQMDMDMDMVIERGQYESMKSGL